MSICNVRRRASNWQPLSAEARATLQAQPDQWDYVELWDGAAAQMTAFGATRRGPDLFNRPAEALDKPDPAQLSLDLT